MVVCLARRMRQLRLKFPILLTTVLTLLGKEEKKSEIAPQGELRRATQTNI